MKSCKKIVCRVLIITVSFFVTICCAVNFALDDYFGATLTDAGNADFELGDSVVFEYEGAGYVRFPDNYSIDLKMKSEPLTLLKHASGVFSFLNKAYVYSYDNDFDYSYLSCYYDDFLFEGGDFYRKDLVLPTISPENIKCIQFVLYESDKKVLLIEDVTQIKQIINLFSDENELEKGNVLSNLSYLDELEMYAEEIMVEAYFEDMPIYCVLGYLI